MNWVKTNLNLMKFLEENGILPGVEVEVSDILSFNQTISLKLKEHLVSLGFTSARFIYVEKGSK